MKLAAVTKDYFYALAGGKLYSSQGATDWTREERLDEKSDSLPTDVIGTLDFIQPNGNNRLVMVGHHTDDAVSKTMVWNKMWNSGLAEGEAEWTFVEDNIGPRNMIGEIDRLPQDRVDVVLDYYFGFTSEDLGDDALLGLHYFDETDAYYFDPAGVDLYGIVEFTDGYYREDSNTVSLYYMHRNEKREYVVTIQSKWKDLHQYGYYILSNLPAEK